jgi:hypothetical protein
VIVHCGVCQAQLPPGLDRCPECRSDSIMVGIETPSGTRVSGLRGGTIRLTGKEEPEYKNGAQFLRHHAKLEWSSQRQRFEYVERIFNKLEGTYVERYYDPDTGEIVFQKHGPITDQSLHGRHARGH